jgi:hypothetical protein
MPRDVIEVPPLAETVKPVAANADGTAITDSKPAPSVDTATSAMRLRSVFIDILFLSLSQIRSFLIWLEEAVWLLLIPFPYVKHVRSHKKMETCYSFPSIS